MSDFEFELGEDGELIVSEQARATVLAAMKRAVAKNSEDMTPEAYTPPAGEGDEEDDEEELAPDPRLARQRARRLQRDPAALAAASVGERVSEKRSDPMSDLTSTVEAIIYKADSRIVGKLAAAEVERGISVFSSFERSEMVGAIAKRHGDKKLSDAHRELLKWSLLRADVEHISKRASLLDDTIAKARNTVSPEPAVVHGREAIAVSNPRAADAARQRIIDEKRTAAPWMSDEELGHYATGMLGELARAARGKQERARPGTLQRV